MKEFINSINPAYVIEVVKYIAMLILGAATLYYRSNAKLRDMANKYIATAQVLYKDAEGKTRFAWVVEKVYEIVPTALKPLITKALVGKIVQSMFDGAKAYLKANADRAVEAIPEPMPREGANARDY